MSKIQFRIGGAPGVAFNLPSKEVGNPNTCVGTVIINVYGLKCSEPLSFTRSALLQLSDGAKELFNSLKGHVSISSVCESFKLKVSAGSTGNIKVDVSMKKIPFSQPNNAEWQAQASFYDNPECLQQLIGIVDEIES